MSHITIAFVGDSGVGKTSFIKRVSGETWSLEYQPTIGCVESSLNFNTNFGNVQVNVLDFGGDEFSKEMFELGRADGAVIMCDGQSTFDSIFEWMDKIESTIGSRVLPTRLPMVVCVNKIDTSETKEFFQKVQGLNFYVQIYPVSAKSLDNIEKPFIYLMEKAFNKDSISILNP